MKLVLTTRHDGEVSIVHCAGRIVYREEASAFSRMVGRALQHSREVVLDLDEVDRIDGSGLGELVLVHLWAARQEKTLKLAGGNAWVRELFELTRLSSVLAIYSSVEQAVEDVLLLTDPAGCANSEFVGLDA